MPDKKLTDNEIIKALECHKEVAVDNCFECPYVGSLSHSYSSNCVHKMMADALDLINRLKAEIERLKKKSGLTYKITFDQEKLEEIKNDCLERIDYNINEIRANAIKEFAERLKDRVVSKYEYTDVRIFKETSDKLLEEMVGEDNARNFI